MIQIYHNPRCRKSREGLAILEQSGENFEIIKYLDHPPSESHIKDLLKKLDMEPIELVRTNEAIWKSDFKGKELTDNDIVTALSQHPKLMERPIVVKNNKAVVGRPPGNISRIL